MKSKRILGILILTALYTQMVFAQKALSYEEALQICLENNLGIKASSRNIEAKAKKVKAQKGMYLPRVSVTAAFTMMSDDITIDMNPIKESITPLYVAMSQYGKFSDVPNPDPTTVDVMPTLSDPVSTAVVRQKLTEGLQQIESSDWNRLIQKKRFGSVDANFVLPIYAGGKIKAVNKAASVYYDEAVNEREIMKSELSSTLVERYFGLVLAKEALKVREEAYNTIAKHMEDAQRMKEEGLIANADFLHIKVYQSQAERDKKKAERTIDIAQEGFSNILSDDGKTELLPVSSLFINDELPTLDYFISQAKANSLLLKKVQFKKELLKIRHDVEYQGYFPTVNLGGTFRLVEKDLSETMPRYLLGLGVTWNILDGATRGRKLQASKLDQERVDLTYEKVESDITAVITKLYNEAQMYIEEFKDLETADEFAEEYYRVREKAFNQGFATAAEISDANLAKEKVRIDRLQAMYKYDVALGKLLYYAGIIDTFKDYQKTLK